MDDLVQGRTISFDDIARRENKFERYIRRLLPLAFARDVWPDYSGNSEDALDVEIFQHWLEGR